MNTPNDLGKDFHGGGFIKGRNERDQLFCSRLALTFQCLVWDVDYSLAPESPFPTAHEESYAAVSYAFDNALALGADPQKIFLIGHSAGGNLAATVCIKASERCAFRPAGLIMEYSPVDLDTDPAKKPGVTCDMPTSMANTYNLFYRNPEDGKNPYVSPIFADESQLSGFPDTLVISCQRDDLCYEDEDFALKLARSGVTVTCRRFKNSTHGFTINRMDEWKDSLALINRFIQIHIS